MVLSQLSQAFFQSSSTSRTSTSAIPISADWVKSDTTIFDDVNRTVTLKNLRGNFMHQQNQSMETWIEIVLWTPQDDTLLDIVDTTVTANKTVLSGRMTYINGVPTWTGDLSPFATGRYQLANANNIHTMDWDSVDTQILVPTGVNMDGLELMITVHSGINEAAFNEAELNSSIIRENQNQVQINVFPNPASPLNDVNLTVLVPANNSLSIRLFNGNGSFHSTLFTGTVEVGTLHNTTIPSGTLNTGTYFAILEVGTQVYAKSFLIQ